MRCVVKSLCRRKKREEVVVEISSKGDGVPTHSDSSTLRALSIGTDVDSLSTALQARTRM